MPEIAPPQIGLVIREREPLNLEYPFDQLSDFLTPTDLFYIRSHFPTPKIDRAQYTLALGGAVDRPLAFTYADLLGMPSVTVPATLECAGNGRVFLSPQVKGAQWQLGAVSTAQWSGAPLSALLELAGVHADACEVLFEAADMGTPKEEPVPPGHIAYSRSISLVKAADVVIALRMNGDELPPDHGFPVRAIVPGHYGMASVKWLTGIRVLAQPFTGYWQTSDYGYWDYDESGNPVRRALGAMPVKSAIARPRTREIIAAGSAYRIAGAAWGGDAPLQTMEVSTDDGATWQQAIFDDEAKPFVWRRWHLDWTVPAQTGALTLKCRATDAAGNTQPDAHDKRFGTYVIRHTFGIEVVIR